MFPVRSLFLALGAGSAAAAVAYVLNAFLLRSSGIALAGFERYVSPFIEESLKAAFLVYLLAARKTGFLVDTAIQGFAIGAGFALIENISYVAFPRLAQRDTLAHQGVRHGDDARGGDLDRGDRREGHDRPRGEAPISGRSSPGY